MKNKNKIALCSLRIYDVCFRWRVANKGDENKLLFSASVSSLLCFTDMKEDRRRYDTGGYFKVYKRNNK